MSAKEFQFLINPEGSNFSYLELKFIFEQNFNFVKRFSGNTFLPLEETDLEPGVPHSEGKIIGFMPATSFSHPNQMALAKQGIMFNTATTKYLSLEEIRQLGLHELGHNLGLTHTENRHSIMSIHRFRTIADHGLFWRADLLRLHELAPNNPTSVGWVSVDKDLTIMIPAVMSNGEQWSAKLRHASGDIWVVERSYLADDGISMETKAALSDNDELHLHDVSFLGFNYPLVRFRITPDLKFILIRG